MNQFQTKIYTVGYLRLNEYLILNWPCFWWGIFITLDAASEVLSTLLKRWSPFGHSIWVVWGELKLAPTWSKGVWKPGVCGGEGLFAGADPMVVSDYFLPPLFHPLYYFHPDSKISSTDLFLYCWEPLKIITETIAAHLKTLRRSMNHRGRQTSEGRGCHPSEQERMLRIALIACGNGHFAIRLPTCADTQRTLPGLRVAQGFPALKLYF